MVETDNLARPPDLVHSCFSYGLTQLPLQPEWLKGKWLAAAEKWPQACVFALTPRFLCKSHHERLLRLDQRWLQKSTMPLGVKARMPTQLHVLSWQHKGLCMHKCGGASSRTLWSAHLAHILPPVISCFTTRPPSLPQFAKCSDYRLCQMLDMLQIKASS